MIKRPAFQWYPGDFRRDTAVQACSFEARGLWREMIDLMHDGEPYGHLTAGGVEITVAQLARIVGIRPGRASEWLRELEERGVFSRTDAGVIYSRRMVKDEHIRNVRALAGAKGGNPNLIKRPSDEAPDSSSLLNQTANQTANQNPTPAVAVAVCSLQETTTTTSSRGGALAEQPSGGPSFAVANAIATFPSVTTFAEQSPDYAASLHRALTRVQRECGDESLAGFVGLVNGALQGVDGPERTPAEVSTALADWCDNVAEVNKHTLRAYFRGARYEPPTDTTGSRAPRRGRPLSAIGAAGEAAAWKLMDPSEWTAADRAAAIATGWTPV